MSFFSSLFGKKSSSNNQSQIKNVEINKGSANTPLLHLKGKPDACGLYPGELVMLSLAEKYKTTEKRNVYFVCYDRNIFTHTDICVILPLRPDYENTSSAV